MGLILLEARGQVLSRQGPFKRRPFEWYFPSAPIVAGDIMLARVRHQVYVRQSIKYEQAEFC